MNKAVEFWRFWGAPVCQLRSGADDPRQHRLTEVDSDVATFVRTGVILCLTLAIVLGSGQSATLAQIPGRSALCLVLSELATGASWLCYFRVLSLGDAAWVAPIHKLSVVFVAAFGVLFLDERFSALNWLGVALIAAGAMLVLSRA